MLVVCRLTRWPTCWPTLRWDRILNFYPMMNVIYTGLVVFDKIVIYLTLAVFLEP